MSIYFEIINGKLITRALEYNIVEHCNLRCNLCDHSSPLMSAHIVPIDEFVRDVEHLAKFLHVAEFKLIGGEPLMHPDLLHLMERLRQIGISDTITVATNGILLHTMTERFWDQIDRLWLSIYPGVRMVIPLEDVEMQAKKFGFTLDIFRMDSFRHTTLSRAVNTPEVVHAVYKACELPHINYCHTLRRGIYYKCSPAPFSQERLEKLGVGYQEEISDGVPIHDNPELLDNLLTYFSCKTPLPACTFCLGSSGKWFPHRQMTGQELKNNGQPHGDPGQLIDWAKIDLPISTLPSRVIEE